MSGSEPNDLSRLDPIQGILEVMERASMTGTNKLGLLLALLDLAPERIEDNSPIAKEELTERYLNIHWEHARPYGGIELRHSSVKKKRNDDSVATDTTVMQQIYLLREELKSQGYGDLQEQILDVVQSQVGDTDWWDENWDSAVTSTKKDLWRNPIDKLQNLPGAPKPFLYEVIGQEVRFIPGVAETLTKFASVLRPLVEFRFAEVVARVNRDKLGQIAEYQIHEHLFGGERSMPTRSMRDDLIEMQDNRCIYSNVPLDTGQKSLDHVMPWSRTRLSQVENFVITTRSVNSSKSDSLLGPELVHEWLGYLKGHSSQFCQIAEEYGWPSDLERVLRTSYNIYKVLDPTVGVWQGESDGVLPIGADGIEAIEQMLS
ncbi:MAG: hypothetical protein KTV68_17475 [Acidimicrobiia bacterium]|nr:hypothetical protein [Acidimicrobiia bacterium]